MDTRASSDNLLFIKQKAKKDFRHGEAVLDIIPLKSNHIESARIDRNVFLDDPAAKAGKTTKLDAVDFSSEGIHTLYLEKLPFPVLVLRPVFTNEDGSTALAVHKCVNAYLSTSDMTLSASHLREIYRKR